MKQALLKRGGGEPSEKILGSISFPVRKEGEKGRAKIPGERGGGGRGKRFILVYVRVTNEERRNREGAV